ncbi:MAG: nicotinate (nicotinamide) nucleotide adenylyltransferase [Gammaproteobacteria bacterium]|nr:nicotinate (nicotinamide) nucleotide adenylyltransferase [Gammaproteobacteria bacterium]MDE0252640.1 nicotinate (nicotinamide) nucleotide adenylyltransferase [Gammaproteobacteria bacterium]MDE0403602.1 nicotinate (nicotinamide) nucleotide adenylyltransferase [Gammaproteobacteria bacterium]
MLVLLGGTFDPVHLGHVHAGVHVNKNLEEPTTLLVAPTPRLRIPPEASFENRWAMVQLACAEHPELLPSDLEITLPAPTETIRTLALLHEKHNQIVYVMGTDSLNQINTWSDSARFHLFMSIFLLQRPGITLNQAPKSFQFTSSVKQLTKENGLIYRADFEMLDISASKIRLAAQENRDFAHFVPPTVYEYIITNNLYQKRD